MDHWPLMQRRPESTVQAVLQVQLSLPLHDVGEQVAVERGVFGQQSIEVERALRCDEFVEPDLAGWQLGPGAEGRAVVGIRPSVPTRLKITCRILEPDQEGKAG